MLELGAVLGPAFHSVKQGDPLSPLLFGLLIIDELEGLHRVPIGGAHVGASRCQSYCMGMMWYCFTETAGELHPN